MNTPGTDKLPQTPDEGACIHILSGDDVVVRALDDSPATLRLARVAHD